MDLSKYQGLILILVFIVSKALVMYFGFYTFQDFDAFLDEYGNENTYYEIVSMYQDAKKNFGTFITLKIMISLTGILLIPVIAAGLQLVIFANHWFGSFFNAYLYSTLISFLIIVMVKFSWYTFVDPYYSFAELKEFKRIVSIFAVFDPEKLHTVPRVILSYLNLEFISFFGLLIFSFKKFSNQDLQTSVQVVLKTYVPILVTGMAIVIIYKM